MSVRPPLRGRTGLRYDGAVPWDQVGTIVVTVVLAVLAGTVYNNRRFDDLNRHFEDVHRRIDDLRADMNARFAQVDARFAQVATRLSELREDLWGDPRPAAGGFAGPRGLSGRGPSVAPVTKAG